MHLDISVRDQVYGSEREKAHKAVVIGLVLSTKYVPLTLFL